MMQKLLEAWDKLFPLIRNLKDAVDYDENNEGDPYQSTELDMAIMAMATAIEELRGKNGV